MKPRWLTRLTCIAAVLAFSSCEGDPSSDHNTPGGLVPELPSHPGSTGGTGLEATVNGQYVRVVNIEKGTWTATGPGQEVKVTFNAQGMRNVRQVFLRFQCEPAAAFALDASRFASRDPLYCPGVDASAGGGLLETGAAVLGTAPSVEGDGLLGTLTLVTGPSFTATTKATVRVLVLSIGPNRTTRDDYAADDLNLGITLNGP
jgi:hypothetical protein